MKQIFISLIIILSVHSSHAQSDSSTIEQYCQVIATPRLLSNRVTIDIDMGEEKSIWLDTRLRTDQGKLKKFHTIIDALNYMGQVGWIFVNAYPVKMGASEIYHFAFKRHVSKKDYNNN